MSVVVVCKVVLISLQSFVLRLAVDLLCMQSCTFASTKLASREQKVPEFVCDRCLSVKLVMSFLVCVAEEEAKKYSLWSHNADDV